MTAGPETSSMKLTDDQRGACVQCRRGDHHLCWGHDGPMTSHPDSLPLCDCTCHPRLAKPAHNPYRKDRQ